MILNSETLVGYLRAEFTKASRLRVWMFFTQLAVAVPAAISVVVADEILLYVLAVLGTVLLISWWVLNTLYGSARNAAQSARRAAMLMGGLKDQLSASEIQNLRERLTVTAEEAKAFEKKDYYASNLAPSSSRLGEMLEESAFYSAKLQRVSASTMLAIILVFALLAGVIALTAIPMVERDGSMVGTRILLSVLVFIMSSDVLGALLAHRSSASALDNIRARLVAADRSRYPQTDVLLIMADYNAAVESAPESVPFAYRLLESRLNQQWRQYLADRAEVRKDTEEVSS
ncbi:hypothetical protein IC232_08580 [Microvirga sp. BT688]|uniref:hypothetical protein n=1 Tax=Microvirga sp. TaxID=1873136 RepID=UPI001689A0DA|nr:hypothetical protein [Microvirga sp.]MBD2746751.1 hypothetical protein [Microvirga sp.]